MPIKIKSFVKTYNFIRGQWLYWKAYVLLRLYMRSHTTQELIEKIKEAGHTDIVYSGDSVIFNLHTGGKIIVSEDTVEILTKDYVKRGRNEV